MKKSITYFLYLFCYLVLTSCSTYKTYYSKTIRNGVPENTIDVLRLDLSQSQDTLVSVKNLRELRVLHISCRADINVEELLEKLPNPLALQVLVLDSMNLVGLPACIRRFQNLKHLSLNGNARLDIEVVVQSIKELPLEFLNYQNNGLKQIPKSINELQLLEDLNMSYNLLEGFDNYESLASLEHLNSLWLTGNQLTKLSESLGSLKQLRNLYIEHNKLAHIPLGLIGMEGLWVLHAGHNLFTELSTTFAKMPGLKLLHVNNCKIRAVPLIYNHKKDYSILGLILDNNELIEEMKIKYRRKFDHFFILSI